MAPINYHGEKLKFDPRWKGPLGVARSRTNYNWLVAFKIYFLVWVAISIYALGTLMLAINRRIPKYPVRSTMPAEVPQSAGRTFMGALVLSIPFILLATGLMFLYIYLLQRHAVFLSYSYTFALFLISALSLGKCVYDLSSDKLDEEQVEGLLAVGIVTLVFCMVSFVFIICCGSKIKLTAEVIREASQAVMHFPSLFVFPIIAFVIQMFIIGLTFFVSLALYLCRYNSYDLTMQVVHYIFIVIIVFGGLWLLSFADDFLLMCLYGSFATWYWSIDKNTIPENTVSQIINITVRYHLGSIALGSLLLNLVHMIIQFVVSQLFGSNSDQASSDNEWRCACKICTMIISLFGNLGRNAFIFVASHGTGFWDSTKDACSILKRNLMNIIVITEVSGGLVMIAQMFTVGITLLIAYGICDTSFVSAKQLDIALIIIGMSSILMCGNICAVLNAAIDTIFLSVLEDYERNDGSPGKPYFMSNNLKGILIV